MRAPARGYAETMSNEILKGREEARFPALLLLGLLALGAIAIIAAIAVGGEYAIPVLVLAAVVVGCALAYRLLAGGNRGRSGEADSSENVPAQPANDSRPLGDTPEAHDEINVHDLPLDNPGRQTSEAMAGDEDATTRGMAAGGAGGTDRFRRERDDLAQTTEVSQRESRQGADPT